MKRKMLQAALATAVALAAWTGSVPLNRVVPSTNTVLHAAERDTAEPATATPATAELDAPRPDAADTAELEARELEAPELEAPETRFEAAEVHMGTTIQIVLYASEESTAKEALQAAFAEVARLNDVMSDYQSDSELSQLSEQSPTSVPVPVSEDLWIVLDRAQQFSRQSEGAFDVTVGPLSKLWRRARRRKQLPEGDQLAAARKAIGYQAMRLHKDDRSVELLRPHMRLDLGGIAKGYAADAALTALQRRGVTRALVNAGGDMAVGDPPPGKKGWPVGVAPLGQDGPPSRFLLLSRCGIATSGDAWQFVEIAGTRYSHILDPRTGLGLTERSGVTVVAPDAMTADALASAVSVLGPKAGLELVERLEGCSALVVQAGGDRVTTRATPGFLRIPATPPPRKSEPSSRP